MKLLTPAELREATERDYRAACERAGAPVDNALIRQAAIADLELVDAAYRNGEICGTPKIDNDPIKERPDLIAQAHQQSGTHDADGKPLRFRALHANPQSVSERWGYATMRMYRIMEGAGRSSSLAGSAANAAIPRLAMKIVELEGNFLTRGAPPPSRGRVDRNPFRGLSDKDAARVYMRLVEDICDESTGVMGSWYVK